MKLRAAVLSPIDPTQIEYTADAVVEIAPPYLASVEPYRGQSVDEDLRPAVLIPGFVDAHVHYPQTAVIGRAAGPLLPWLQHVIFPEEARFADLRYATRIAERFCLALAAAGTTRALVYGPVFAEAVDVLFSVATQYGQALVAGPVWMDQDLPPGLSGGGGLDRLIATWHGRAGHQVAVLPRFALSCSPAALAEAAAVAARHDLIVSTHLAENADECGAVRERFTAPDYLAVYERAGLVRPGAVFAHAVQCTPDEWARLGAAGAIVAHCPDSNAFLGSGDMPIAAARAHGVRVAIGSDVAAGRSFRIPRILSAAYDAALRRGTLLTPAELLWLGTRGDAVRMGDVGFVQAGGRADLCAFVPPVDCVDPLSSLLFDTDGTNVVGTWVDGRRVFGPR